MAEHIVARPLNALQNAQATVDDAAKNNSRAPRNAQRERCAANQHCAGVGNLVGHQRAPAIVDHTAADLRLGHIEPREVALRQVDAAILEVDRDVLPEVDQMKGRADRIGVGQIGRARGAEQMQHQVPHRMRGAAAIVKQSRPIGEAGGVDLLIERGHDIVERCERQFILCNHASEFAEQQRMHRRHPAACHGVEAGPKVGEERMTLGGAPVAFLGDVSGRTGNLIDHADRRAQPLRQQGAGDR